MYPHHSTHIDTIREIVDSFSLELSIPIDQVSTHYTDNFQDMNSVLDLIFLYTNAEKLNNHTILPDLQDPSNHASLLVHIIIEEEFIQEKKLAIVKNNKEEKEFVNKLRNQNN